MHVWFILEITKMNKMGNNAGDYIKSVGKIFEINIYTSNLFKFTI